MNIVVLLGAPGSGKGTVAARLAARLPAARHLASGDLLRAAAREGGTPFAAAAAEAMRRGDLVPDAIVDNLMIEQMRSCPPGAWLLLDGYPRNVAQAATLAEAAGRLGGTVRRAILLDVPRETLIRRLAGRRVCPRCAAGYHVESLPPRVAGICDACGAGLVAREDDQPAKIARRLEVYRQQTAALAGWYAGQGLLTRIDGDASPDEVAERVARAVTA